MQERKTWDRDTWELFKGIVRVCWVLPDANTFDNLSEIHAFPGEYKGPQCKMDWSKRERLTREEKNSGETGSAVQGLSRSSSGFMNKCCFLQV